jgi:long-chain fatty acid transport protein
MKRVLILSLLTSSLLVASGYRIPEQSVKSMATSGAYIANANGADSAYFNPANMAFNENKSFVEGALTYIGLSTIKYKDNRVATFNSESESETFFIPTLFYSSKDYQGVRYGFSLTVPGGLTRRWESPFAKTFAQEFALEIIELNPAISYKVNNQFALGAGARVIYSNGIVKSDGSGIGKPAVRDMEGDTIEYGYNVALAYKPLNNLNISATYRSNIDLNEEGNAKLYLSGTKLYDGGASVEVPLPAVGALAIAYNFGATTLEAVYDITYWSEYKNLDFEYKSAVPIALKAAFDDPKTKDWEDSQAIRLGITHQLNSKITLMGGFAIDENPVPSSRVSFELPDADAKLYSAGINYKYSEDIEFGASFLYDQKDDRSIKNDEIDGEFTDASATLVTFGASYKY